MCLTERPTIAASSHGGGVRQRGHREAPSELAGCGQGEEDVVEGGPAHARCHRRPAGRERVEHVPQVVGGAVGGHPDDRRHRRRRPSAPRRRGETPRPSAAGALDRPVGERQLDLLGADRRLSSSAVPVGHDRPPSSTDDPVGQLVGLLQVLRGEEDRRPRSPTSSPTTSQTACRLRGSRPVVGSSRNSTSGRATRLMARSTRRRMPPENVFTRRRASAVRSNRSSSSAVRRRRSARPRRRSRPSAAGSPRPVSWSSTAANCPVRLMRRAHRRRARRPRRGRRPGRAAVRRLQRGEDPHGRRLAGAVRPEQREHRAAGDGQVDAREHRLRPVRLAQAGRLHPGLAGSPLLDRIRPRASAASALVAPCSARGRSTSLMSLSLSSSSCMAYTS